MSVTDLLNLGSHSLVREHGHVRKHVMLDLIVQPAVHEVVDVAPSAEVYRPNDSSQIELIALDL